MLLAAHPQPTLPLLPPSHAGNFPPYTPPSTPDDQEDAEMLLARRRSAEPTSPPPPPALTMTTARARALFRSSKPSVLPTTTTTTAITGSRLGRRLSPSPRRRFSLDETSSHSSSTSPTPTAAQALADPTTGPGSVTRLSPAERSQLLPHMRSALDKLDASCSSSCSSSPAAAGASRKTAVHVVLAEKRVFVRPPRCKGPSWEDDEWDGPPPADESSPTIVQGVLAILSSDRKTVDDVKLMLTAHQTLALKRPLGGGRSAAEARLQCPPEEFDLARWEASFVARSSKPEGHHAESSSTTTATAGVELERGLNLFRFEFCLPPTSSPSITSSYGRLRYVLRSTVPGLGSRLSARRKRLATRDEVELVALPRTREDAGELRLAVKRSVGSGRQAAWAGRKGGSIEIESDHLTLGADVNVRLSLIEPPPTTTILGLRAFVAQTVLLRNAKGERERVASPRRIVGVAGRRAGWLVQDVSSEHPPVEDWIAGSGRSTGDEPVVFDGNTTTTPTAGGEWSFSFAGQIPADNVVRPTTLHWSPTTAGLRFGSELVVEALVAGATGPAEVVTLYRAKVELADASCEPAALMLPPYAA